MRSLIAGAVALLLSASCALAAITPERKTIDLSGEWRFSTEDRPEFARADLDDSRWSTLRLPGFWEEQGHADKDGYVWLRRNVRIAPGAQRPVALRLGQVFDAVELFINGTRVGAAAGTIGHGRHLFPLDAPVRLDLNGALRDGDNVIALRIFDDPTRSHWVWRNIPYPTGKGLGGIQGDMVLETAPAVHIRDVRVEVARKAHPLSTFRFVVSLANGGSQAKETTVTLSAGETRSRKLTVPPGGAEAVLELTARPQFGQKQYAVSVTDGDGRDRVTGLWHSVIIEARDGKVFVNGEPFVAKGLNGNFDMRPEIAAGQARLLQDCNVNMVRSHCLGMWFKETQKHADIFLLPLVTDMSCRPLTRWQEPGVRDTERAELVRYVEHARANPLVFGWNSSNEVEEKDKPEALNAFLRELYDLLHAQDGWHRPVLYSNLMHQRFTEGQDIVGFNYYVDPEDFNFAGVRDITGKKPYLLTECDTPGVMWRPPYWDNVPLHIQYNRGIFEKSVAAGGSGVTLFSGMFDYHNRHIGIYAGSRVREDFRDFVRYVYRDVDHQVVGRWQVGQSAAIRVTNIMPYALRDFRLECGTGASQTVAVIPPGGQAIFRLRAAEGRVTAIYTTHGGMRHRTSFDPVRAWQQPTVTLPEEKQRAYRVLSGESLLAPGAMPWWQEGKTAAQATAAQPEAVPDSPEARATRFRFSFGAPGRLNDWVRYSFKPRNGDFTGGDGLAIRLKNDGTQRRLSVILFDKAGDSTALHASAILSGSDWQTLVLTFQEEFEKKPAFDLRGVERIRFQIDDYVMNPANRQKTAVGPGEVLVGDVSLVKAAPAK